VGRCNQLIIERIVTGHHQLRWLKKPFIRLLLSDKPPTSVNAAARMIGCSVGTLERHFKEEIPNASHASIKRFIDSLVLLQARESMIEGASLARTSENLRVSPKTIRRMAARAWNMTPAEVGVSPTEGVVARVLELLGVS
jgi:hypothetical protein